MSRWKPATTLCCTEMEGLPEMLPTQVDLGLDLASLLQQLDQPLAEAARELIAFELYRRGKISSGKAAALLGLDRLAFIQHAARLGIPYLDMTAEEWDQEMKLLGKH